MWQRLKKWLRGEFVPRPNDSDSGLHFLGGDYKRPVLARMISASFDFYLIHWKWCLGAAAGIVVFIINYPRGH